MEEGQQVHLSRVSAGRPLRCTSPTCSHYSHRLLVQVFLAVRCPKFEPISEPFFSWDQDLYPTLRDRNLTDPLWVWFMLWFICFLWSHWNVLYHYVFNLDVWKYDLIKQLKKFWNVSVLHLGPLFSLLDFRIKYPEGPRKGKKNEEWPLDAQFTGCVTIILRSAHGILFLLDHRHPASFSSIPDISKFTYSKRIPDCLWSEDQIFPGNGRDLLWA